LEEVRKKLAVQEAENEKLRKEVASQKVENLEERKAESMLRDADAKLRLADVQILKISEKQRAENRQAAPKAKRQKDVITEARKLMVEEIQKYLATKNYTANLKKLIDSEIRRLATPPKTGIAIEDSGTPGAISILDGNHYPKYAFQNAAGNLFYHSKEGLPQMVWMRYSKPHRLAKISFSSVQANMYMVKKFAVVGSNDCSTWTTLLAVNNAGFPNDGDNITKTWMIPAEDRMSYKCIGLKAIEFSSYQVYKYLALKNVRMWEEV